MNSEITLCPAKFIVRFALNLFSLLLLMGNVWAQNVAPEIIGQSPLSTPQDNPIEILLDHLQVTDPDNVYPDDFTLTLGTGTGYSLNGTTVTPDAGFTGALTVPVTVSDGQDSSPSFALTIEVTSTPPENIPPTITGQSSLSIEQGQTLSINFTDLMVDDADDPYPTGFTMTLQPGSDYTISGQTVTPDATFSGVLTIPVTVNDGEDESEPFSLSVTVTPSAPTNEKPIITAQTPITTEQDTPVTIEFNNLTVTDPDDTYPTGFTMTLSAGTNYTVNGRTITPAPAFAGTLSVPVTVNDGEDESEPFTLSITVTSAAPTNQKPVITAHTPITTEQATPVTIEFNNLTVTDPDDTYPTGFTMTLSAGTNYTVSGRTITPAPAFAGTLTVPVTVNDGEDSSDPFNVVITVTASEPENVKPVITGQVELSTEEGKSISMKLEHLTVTDPDDPYPAGFKLSLSDGPNYSVNGSNIKPDDGFTGQLTVPVTVNDGEASSDPFNVIITVTPKPVVNIKPVIIGQTPLTMLNTEALTIALSHLFVTDPDDTYPTAFTLKIHPGSNYTVSGRTITPPANFTGTLTVKVSVNDGTDESNIFDLKITVNAPASNVKPVITGQQELTTFTNTAITLRLTHLIVSDPDDVYPGAFTMEILAGENYSASGTTVTPASGFTGSLSVGVRVNDGTVWSETFILTISVVEKDELRISGQDEVVVGEDSIFTLNLSHLEVNDPSNSYPAGFQLVISPGENYSAQGNTITPGPNFTGTLEVPVQVRNAASISNIFKLIVLVTPVNDEPVFAVFDAAALTYSPANGDMAIADEVVIEDPDHDQLVFAEVLIDPQIYLSGKDLLTAEPSPNIRTVFDANTGIVVLLGVASLDEYQSTLRSVRYLYDNDTLPEIRTRPIHFRLSDGEGFSEVYSKNIAVSDAITLDIPNVFSPNDDDANDTWVISRQNQSENTSVTIRVFDKRGRLVYESNSLDQAWDGRFRGENLPSDSYFYTIEVRSNVNPLMRKGVVTILR